jgi:acyl-CoA reductase-like NAD-dependent aldehyde dehydrogenase
MEWLTSHNPATGEVVGDVPVTPVEEIPGIVARARAAQPAWEALGLEGRAGVLKKTIPIFAERVQHHGELITAEMGKPIKEGLGEAKSLGHGLERELDEIVDALSPEVVEDGRAESTVYHDPLGVVGAITPWNFPMSMPAWMLIPSLAAGNAVVFKPS